MPESIQNKKEQAELTSSFVNLIARDLIGKYGHNLQFVRIVMPGAGAIPALTEAFKQEANGKSLILPGMEGMDSFVNGMSRLKRSDSLNSLAVLFHSFKKHHNPEEKLASFFPIGQVLLSDFDLILLAGRKTEHVFAALKRWDSTGASFADFMDEEQKALMRNFSLLFRDDLRESRSRFLRLWENLPDVFEEFERLLLEQGLGTPGMVYRDAETQLRTKESANHFQYYFAGFSSLSGLETSIMQHLKNDGKAEFAWDIPTGFAENPSHELSRVFSRVRRIPEFQPSLEDWNKRCRQTNKPTVKEITCQGLAGMAQWVLLTDLPFQDTTAFIVSDPGLVPLLSGRGKLPNGRNLRFSMGYPMSYTAFSRWIYKILQWISRPQTLQCQAFLPVLDDHHFRKFFSEAAKQGQSSFSPLHIPSLADIRNLKGIPDWIFAPTAVDWLQSFTDWLNEKASESGGDLWAQSCIKKAAEVCRSLREFSILAADEFTFPVLQSCLHAAMQNHDIQLEKEEGPEWKAMGLFESRNLDFTRIVIMPGDEGLFPSSGNAQSLIPESVRRAFNLPLRQQETEDQAYQFYRLCQRSTEIIFLTTEGDGNRRSRFLDQIEFGGYFSYKKESIRFSSAIQLSPEIRVFRNEFQMERALAYRTMNREDEPLRKLSPSSLHALISCPLRFHYQKIDGLKEPEQISGLQMSAQDYGNWIHTGIQLLLEKIAGHHHYIRPEEYAAMEANWDEFAGDVWKNLEGKTTPGVLSDYPVESALGKIMAGRFFQFMKTHKPHRWLKNEYPFPEVKIGCEGNWFSVGGRADIVLEEEGCFRLLDLKTGAFKDAGKLLLQLDDEGLPAEGKIVDNKDYFQMICYNRLASEDPGFKGKPVRSCLFYLAQPSPALADPFLKVKDREEEAAIYEGLDSILLSHLNRLIDASVPVTQAKDSKVCTFCSFNAMCRR